MNAPRNGAGDYPVRLAYRVDGNDRIHPICQTRWTHDPRSRNLGLIFANENSRTPRVLVFPDFRAETQAE